MKESVGRLARQFGLSRSTLLHYDKMGLLSPAARSAKGYRLYGEADARRLEAICRCRETGLDLAQIRELLDGGAGGRTVELLEARLAALDAEIARLHEQQRVVHRLLASSARVGGRRAMDKRRWVEILRAAGLDDRAMRRWHVEFEAMAPAAHRDFLASLGLPRAEIARIRSWSKRGGT